MQTVWSASYYDKILAAIAASLAGGLLVGVTTALRVHTGLFAGALAATAFIYHALFWNPPQPTPSRRATVAAILWHILLALLLLTIIR